ncbi:MAG: hypothetical protein ABSA49_10825 [Rhizomicrobium sp.]
MAAIAWMVFAASAHAQPAGIMSPGSAAVTGFSGVPTYATEERIDLAGPSLRVIPLPSGPNGLDNVPKTFTVTARDVGQVFGVTLDDQPQPDIFVAATSAYGLGIYQPGHGRLQHGATGAQYTPGLFGSADPSGGPNSIWRIDGTSGQVTLFANVTFNGIQNTPASLGGLAYDARTQQLFVADRATGMIHRFGLDGSDRGVFDHGVDGRGAANLPPVPFDPATLANIASPSFDAQNPKSWGFAPAPRRIFGLAVRGGRLFYAVADGPQIWSVGIRPDGSFAHDAHYEVGAPALRPGTEISQIAFDTHPHMYVAERAASTGAPDFVSAAASGQDRVERFSPKNYGDPSPGFWQPPGDQYAIGLNPQFQNADGGVDIKCGSTVWATGERLLDPGNAPPGSFPRIDGLQGTDANLVEPANMPPQQSRYVNYYDNQADPASRGHMGSIAIWNMCSGSGGAPMPPPPPPQQTGYGCPPGTAEVGGACLVPPMCPEDSIFRDGYCIYPHCPDGFIHLRGQCMPPPRACRYGEVYLQDRCVPIGCPRGLDRADNGYCRCPDGRDFRDGQCMPPQCPRDQIYRDGRCLPVGCPPDRARMDNGQCGCPRDQQYRDGRCVPVGCPPDRARMDNGQCGCPRDQQYRDGRCVPVGCPTDRARMDNGQCGCPRDQINRDGRCVPVGTCPPGTLRTDNGQCGCPRDEIKRDGRCVSPTNPNCPPGITVRGCTQQSPACPRGEVLRDGRCTGIVVHPAPNCSRGEVLRDGRCIHVHVSLCPAGETMRDGQCVSTRALTVGPVCRRGEVVIDGQCREPNRTLVTTPAPRCPTGEVYRDGACHGPERVRIDQGGPDRVRSDQGGGSSFSGGRPPSRQPECGRDEYLKDGRCVRR